jgi:hypothetical protein
MRAASTVTAIGLALWLTAPSAHALGFGRIANATQLGQRLNFSAEVRLGSDETLARECVSAEVLVGDNRLQPNQVRVTLEPGTDPNERSVRVTSTALIDEPVVTVSITLGCASRITHRFVAFIDPPLINMAQSAPIESAPLPAQRVDSQVAPLVDIVQGSNAPAARRSERPPRPPRPRALAGSSAGGRATGEAPAASPDAAQRRPDRANRLAAAPRPAAGPRLRLEAMPAAAVGRAASEPQAADAALTAALAAAAASAASAADAAGQKLAKERERIQALEDGMKRLRDDSQATQKALTALQARLNQAEAERYANPLVYSLAWLSALLALAVAAMWWRQSRQRGNPQWWNSPAAAAAAEAAEARQARNASLREQISAPQVFATGPDVAGALNPATIIEPPVPVTPTAIAPVPPVAQPEPTRELSVEELIDLEQQAEFFIVLGQDEAAIDLLMSHVRSDGGISPLPYLKLLEIYRRRGEVDAYQRIRERFNRRFNAYAPDWDSDLQQGRSLEDYPAVMQQLESLWSGPERTMECLDGLLFRRKQADQTFDLPAYRELLFLYSIARDLAEQEASRPGADVDLLLPLGEPDDLGPISQLMTTTDAFDMRSQGMQGMQGTQPLDLDVTFTRDLEPKRLSSESGFINLNDLDPPSSKTGKR